MGRISVMEDQNESTPIPTEIGEELIELILNTSERTGVDIYTVAQAICHATHIQFDLNDGKLNITEEALLALGPQMMKARIKCEGLKLPQVVSLKTPSVKQTNSEVKKFTFSDDSNLFDRVMEAIASVPFLLWFPIILIVAFLVMAIGEVINPNATSEITNRTLERAEWKARNGMATEMTKREADAFRKKQEADSAAHRKAVLGH